MIDIWRTHQLFGELLACGFFSILVSKTFGKAFALALFYTLFSCIWFWEIPQNGAATIILLCVGVVAFSPRQWLKALWASIAFIVYLNTCIVLFNGFGIFNAGSMDVAVTMLFVPYFVYLSKKCLGEIALILFIPIGIAAFQSRTALVMLAVMGVVQLWVWGRKRISILSASLGLIGAALYAYQKLKAFDYQIGFETSSLGAGRLANWRDAFQWWGPQASWIFGTGTGSYQWIGPQIAPRKTDIFLFMHNEYLQALFEQGALGVLLFGIVGFYAFKGAKYRHWLFMTFVGLSVMCLAQYPFRFFLTQLAITILLRLAFEPLQIEAEMRTQIKKGAFKTP